VLSKLLHNNTKKAQNSTHKKTEVLLHSVELSTAVIKVWYKSYFNSTFSQNHHLQCVMSALIHACWNTTTARGTAWLSNHEGMIKFDKLGGIYYQTEPNLSVFSESDLINDDSSFCSQILFTYMTCIVMVLSFGKLILNVSLSVNSIFDDVSIFT